MLRCDRFCRPDGQRGDSRRRRSDGPATLTSRPLAEQRSRVAYDKSSRWVKAHRPHLAATILALILGLPALWFALAYGGLPRLWSHHEHKKGKLEGVLVSYTAQGIPGDPINVAVEGSPAALDCSFRNAGWSKAETVSVRTGLKIGASVLLSRPYPDAPVSPLYMNDRQQDVAYQIDEGRSADRRHHIRFWHQAGDRWLASATFDRGVGVSLFTFQITHHIGRDVDQERDLVASMLVRQGATRMASVTAGPTFGRVHRNGGGDRYLFDGRVAVLRLPETCRARP